MIDLRLNSQRNRLSGWDVVRLVKAHAELEATRLLVISADTEELSRRIDEAVRMDGVQLLSKPFTLDALLVMVADALRDRAGRAARIPHEIRPRPPTPDDGRAS